MLSSARIRCASGGDTVSIRCVRGDQGSACPEGLGSASWRQKGPRRGSARWVWSDPVSQNGTPASAGSLPGTGDWAQNRAWRAGIMSFPLWTMDGRGIRRGWAECLPLASGRFCPFLGRKPGHSRCLGSSATPRILLCRRKDKRALDSNPAAITARRPVTWQRLCMVMRTPRRVSSKRTIFVRSKTSRPARFPAAKRP